MSTLSAYQNGRTLEEIRLTLEAIANECLAAERAAHGREAELLRAIVQSAEVARERVLDVSIGISKYITHCLEADEGDQP